MYYKVLPYEWRKHSPSLQATHYPKNNANINSTIDPDVQNNVKPAVNRQSGYRWRTRRAFKITSLQESKCFDARLVPMECKKVLLFNTESYSVSLLAKTSSESNFPEPAQKNKNLDAGQSLATEFSQTSRLACMKIHVVSPFETILIKIRPMNKKL